MPFRCSVCAAACAAGGGAASSGCSLRPDVVQQQRLAASFGCMPIGLHQRRVERHPSSRNGTSAMLYALRELDVHRLESRWYSAHHNWAACACRAAAPCAARCAQRDHALEVVLGAVRAAGRAGRRWRPAPGSRSAAAAPSSARGRRARPPAVVSPLTLAFTTLKSVPFLRDLPRQQAHPTLLDADAVAGAEAVAEHQDHRRATAGAVPRCGDGVASARQYQQCQQDAHDA